MSEDRNVLRDVAWQDVFPGMLLLSAWKVAINLRAIVLAAAGVLLTWLGWLAVDQVFSVSPEDSLVPGWFDWSSPDLSAPLPADRVFDWWSLSPVAAAWTDLTRPFVNAFAPVGIGRFFYLFISGLWALAVWAFVGGAITRMAAVQLAREEKPSWGQTLSFARAKWPSYFAAPMFPLAGVLLATVPIAILGLLVRAGGLGVVVTAVLWPLVLCAGLVMAVLLVGLFLNWGLMWPTISTEGTDSFDALSRSFAYSFQRPLRYAAYLFIVAAMGVLVWAVVVLFASAVLSLSFWAVSWGSGDRLQVLISNRDDLHGAERFGIRLILWWSGVVSLLTTGFIFSYFFSAVTAVYLLLRYHIDATETDEVYLPDSDQPYGLPPLTTDSAGVVKVADAPMHLPTDKVSPEG